MLDDNEQSISETEIFTASSNQMLFDEMKNSGVKEVFKKPCSIDDLAEVIEKYRPAIGE
jgi:hypothetical protein